MFKRILIANRGEIALRVLRTAREMGIECVAVYSDFDRRALHARMADVAVALGGTLPSESYLDMDKILAAAERTGAEAIHPGYGFLSENAVFAERVQSAGLAWIGPPPDAIRAMGDKITSRRVMKAAGVPVVPGLTDPVADAKAAVKAAEGIGYPIALKAAAGEKLHYGQEQVGFHGHAIEVRVNAEDPSSGFLPSTGTIRNLRLPGGPWVRIDSCMYRGMEVGVSYDPMLAKIIAHGPTREAALQRLLGALDDTRVHGVVTNLPFLRALLRAPEVRKAAYDTEWIEREFLEGFAQLMAAPAPDLALAAAAIAEATMVANGAPARAATGKGSPAVNPFQSLGRWRHGGLES